MIIIINCIELYCKRDSIRMKIDNDCLDMQTQIDRLDAEISALVEPITEAVKLLLTDDDLFNFEAG